jgi:transposase
LSYIKVRGAGSALTQPMCLGRSACPEQMGAGRADDVRAALNAVAAADPEWLAERADPEWFERYARRIEDQRLPKGKKAREQYLKAVGADGLRLLGQLDAPHTPEVLKELAEVQILRQIWEHHYERIDGRIRVLNPKEMPEAAQRIESPYEVEARFSTKRSMDWVGYKVHLTESCDEGFPHLITDVHTTTATATDVKQLGAIQQRLARSGLLPAEQLADSSYVCGSNLVWSHARHRSTSSAHPTKTILGRPKPTKAST